MPQLTFSHLLIIESIPAGEFHTGNQLYQALASLPDAQDIGVAISYFQVSSRAELEHCLSDIRFDSIKTDRIPLLHFECHGNDNGIGLANGDFLYWDELCAQLTQINIATRLNLFVSIAACLGAYLASQLIPTERAPVSACLSITKSAYPDELYRGFHAFYHTLLTTRSGNSAIAALKRVSLAENQSFYLAEIMESFKLAYRTYLAKQCTPEKYRERASWIVEERKENGLSPAKPDDVYHHLVESERPSFERFRQHYFMYDILPENIDRFPVTFDDIAPAPAEAFSATSAAQAATSPRTGNP